MTRRRKAIIFAVFGYGQNVVGMLVGLVVTRLVLGILGRDIYGLWIASGALLTYAGFADIGVLGVLPWMIAEADGRKDDSQIRALLKHGFAFALGASVAFAAIATILWHFFPSLLHLKGGDRDLLYGPLAAAASITAAGYPLRIFSALLTGKQDATFVGVSGMTQVLLSAATTAVLVIHGSGLYALAIGTTLPPALSTAAALIRARIVYPSVLTSWPPLGSMLLRRLAIDGIGVWLISFGYSMVAASDPLILAYAGLRTSVASFAITSRLALTLTQAAFILPDAGLVGLAQLSAEGTPDRVRTISLAVIRLNLLVAGAVASAVLGSNLTFVRLWVGDSYFLGLSFNSVLAANAIMAGAVHGLGTVASVLGKRVHVGGALVLNGATHIVLATLFAKHFGPRGVAVATLISGSITCLPICLYLVRGTLDLSLRRVLAREVLPWFVRFTPLAVLVSGIGVLARTNSVLMVVPACMVYGLLYLWWMKPLYRDLPLGPRISGWLRSLRLLEISSESP